MTQRPGLGIAPDTPELGHGKNIALTQPRLARDAAVPIVSRLLAYQPEMSSSACLKETFFTGSSSNEKYAGSIKVLPLLAARF